MKTHFEIQQREDIRRDLAERMKFVPPDLRVGEQVFHWQEDPSKIQQGRKSGKMVEGGDYCGQRLHGGYQHWCFHFSGKCKQATKSLDTVDLEQLPDSRERTCALAFFVKVKTDVWELFSGNSYLSAILDRQGLMVAAPVDLRTKKS